MADGPQVPHTLLGAMLLSGAHPLDLACSHLPRQVFSIMTETVRTEHAP